MPFPNEKISNVPEEKKSSGTTFLKLKAAFPNGEIADEQWLKIEKLAALHREWNSKINLVSRKDIENLEWHHYAPCLAAVKFLKLMAGTRVAAIDTGGGYAGLLLAILFPCANFTLVDSVAKKILVVSDIAKKLALKNVETHVGRAEKITKKFDFVTGRAVSNLPQFFDFTRQLIRPGAKNSIPNGILYWKGGEITHETEILRCVPEKIYELEKILSDEFFAQKFILHFHFKNVMRYRAASNLALPRK